MAYAPPVTRHNYTNTHATHSNVPWSRTGLVPQCLVELFASPRRCRWAAWAGWVGSSCPPPLRGWGRTAPPLRGGSLPSACSWASSRLPRACVGVRSGASVCGRLSARDRVVEDGCKDGRASLGDGGEDAELLPCLLRDLLGEARVDAVHVLEADGVPRVLSPRILSRNLEFDPFSKSHSWAGYVCFVLLRECISVSVTYGDSCN